MTIQQKAGGRNIRITGTTVFVNGKELPKAEAEKVLAEARTKIKGAAKRIIRVPSLTPGDSVTIINSFGKTSRRK